MASIATKIENYFEFQTPLVWRNVFGIFAMHIAFFYTWLVMLPNGVTMGQFLFAWIYGLIAGCSITVGAHRLWTHRTYKAKLPLRIFLMFLYLTSGMYGMVQWARDHRTHHKYTDTDADPHNATRGFFFSHCGWLMMKRHPEVKRLGKLVDVSDLYEDPVVRFQEKYFVPLFILCFFIIPVFTLVFVFNTSWLNAIVGGLITRYVITLHSTWTVNSVAHLWGYKPYNKNIMAVQNKFAAFVTLGEAWHNFHHTFPWDYRIGEYGQGFQVGAYIVEAFAWLGLAYDLKTASPEMVAKVLKKAGNLKVNQEIPEQEIKKEEKNLKIENHNDKKKEKTI